MSIDKTEWNVLKCEDHGCILIFIYIYTHMYGLSNVRLQMVILFNDMVEDLMEYYNLLCMLHQQLSFGVWLSFKMCWGCYTGC